MEMENFFINQANSDLMVALSYILPNIQHIADSSNDLIVTQNSLKIDFNDFISNQHIIEIKNLGGAFEFLYNFTNKEGENIEPVSYWITDIEDGVFIILDRMVRNIADTSINIETNKDIYEQVISFLDNNFGNEDYLYNIENILLTMKSENMIDISEDNIEKLKKSNLLKENEFGELELNSEPGK